MKCIEEKITLKYFGSSGDSTHVSLEDFGFVLESPVKEIGFKEAQLAALIDSDDAVCYLKYKLLF